MKHLICKASTFHILSFLILFLTLNAASALSDNLCPSGASTTECLIATLEQDLSKMPYDKSDRSTDKTFRVRHDIRQLLIEYSNRNGDLDAAEKYIVQDYDEKAAMYGSGYKSSYMVHDRDPQNYFALLLEKKGLEAALQYKSTIDAIRNHVRKPILAFPDDCEAVYAILADKGAQEALNVFKKSKLCSDVAIAKLDMLVMMRRADFKDAFEQALQFNLPKEFSSSLRTMTYFNKNVLIDGKTVLDEEFKNKALAEALPLLLEKGADAGLSYQRDFLKAFLRFDDVENALKIADAFPELREDPESIHYFIASYLTIEKYPKAVEWIHTLQALPESKRVIKYKYKPSTMERRFTRGPEEEERKNTNPLLPDQMQQLYGHIEDKDFLDILVREADFAPLLFIDVAVAIAETKGTEYLNALKIENCPGSFINFGTKPLYDCFFKMAQNLPSGGEFSELSIARLNIAFGKFKEAANSIEKIKNSVAGKQASHNGSTRSLSRLFDLALGLTNCDIDKIRHTFSDSIADMKLEGDWDQASLKLSFWQFRQAKCVSESGKFHDFIRSFPKGDEQANAAKAVFEYMKHRGNKRLSPDKFLSGSDNSLAQLELLPYLSDEDEQQKLWMYGRAWNWKKDMDISQKKELVALFKKYLTSFHTEEFKVKARQSFFSKMLFFTPDEALELWERDETLNDDPEVAKRVKSYFMSKDKYDKIMYVFEKLPQEVRRKNIIEFFQDELPQLYGYEYMQPTMGDLPIEPEERIKSIIFILQKKFAFPQLLSPFRPPAINF